MSRGARWSVALAGLVAIVGTALAAPPETSDPAFLTGATRAEADRNRVIAFGVTPAAEARQMEASSADEGVVRVLGEAVVPPNSKFGYVRVRGVKPGTTKLAVGRASIDVVVTGPGPSIAPGAEITQPAAGAAVWGVFGVGAEVQPSVDDSEPTVELVLPSGERIKPAAITNRAKGPVRRAFFKVDADKLQVGDAELRLAIGGAEQEAGAVRVKVVHPSAETLTSIEAETPYEGKRPERFKRDRVNIGDDENASGGKFVNNASADPAACFSLRVEEPGWYQVIATAAGNLAGGAYPTIGLVVDGGQQPATNGRLCTEGWHRVTVGVPVRLGRGVHVLTPYFTNDFYAEKLADRNLRLDKIEVARLESASASDEGAGGDAMQGGAMMSMMGGGAYASADNDPLGLAVSPLRIGLTRVLDGQPIAGELEVEGICWAGERGMGTPPRVTLLVNGKAISTQWTQSPRFWIDASNFEPGENTVQLTARLENGASATTPVQTLTWDVQERATGEGRALRYQRFTISDPAWGGAVAGALNQERGGRDRLSAALYSNGQFKLAVPEEFTGNFDVYVEIRGTNFNGAAEATVRLKQEGDTEPTLVKDKIKAPERFELRQAGTVQLKTGRKQIIVAFENDAAEEGKGDRNLFIQAVTLVERPSAADAAPPSVSVQYPSAGAEVFMADAVVCTATDDRVVNGVELVIDGVRTGVRVGTPRATGRFVLPLLARGLAAGEHKLAVRAYDGTNVGDSAELTIRVLAEPPGQLSKYDRAVRMLDRFAFGPDPDQLAAILLKGEETWLRDQLQTSLDDPTERAVFAGVLARFPNGRGPAEVQRRVTMHALATPNPARDRFVLWTENHFSTWIRKTEPQRKWEEHAAFTRLGAAPFGDLLWTSATSPAMLRYLDQVQSYANKLNENYAREIMELHTLGVKGGYTQQDVTNLAHLLTGWTVAVEGDGRSAGENSLYAFRFDPALNDRQATTLLGIDFPAADRDNSYDRVRHALEVLTSHPSTARFVSRKLVEHYVGWPAPERIVDDLARVFEQTHGDMLEMMLAMSRHPNFWTVDEGAAAGTFPKQRLAHPLDFGFRLARTSRSTNAGLIADFLNRTNNGIFDRPTPDGYSERDTDYTDSNAMIQRWRLAQDLQNDLAQLVPEGWRREREKDDTTTDEAWAQNVVDVLAARLTGRVLCEESNRAAIALLLGLEGKRYERIRNFAPLIAQLPEAHLR